MAGDCYQANAKEIMYNDKLKGALLIHGIALLSSDRKPFGHCWIEKGNTVYDFSNGRDIKINKDVESNIYASFRLIKNIKNCESPKWLKNRLEAIGLRPINALVDVTNYLTYDLNRPLHVFDYDKINKLNKTGE